MCMIINTFAFQHIIHLILTEMSAALCFALCLFFLLGFFLSLYNNFWLRLTRLFCLCVCILVYLCCSTWQCVCVNASHCLSFKCLLVFPLFFFFFFFFQYNIWITINHILLQIYAFISNLFCFCSVECLFYCYLIHLLLF